MRIIGASSAASAIVQQYARQASEEAAPEARANALIAIEGSGHSERASLSARNPSAPFIAHLIATRMQAPQTRERRRAELGEAIAVYRSMTKPVSHKRVFGARF